MPSPKLACGFTPKELQKTLDAAKAASDAFVAWRDLDKKAQLEHAMLGQGDAKRVSASLVRHGTLDKMLTHAQLHPGQAP